MKKQTLMQGRNAQPYAITCISCGYNFKMDKGSFNVYVPLYDKDLVSSWNLYSKKSKQVVYKRGSPACEISILNPFKFMKIYKT